MDRMIPARCLQVCGHRMHCALDAAPSQRFRQLFGAAWRQIISDADRQIVEELFSFVGLKTPLVLQQLEKQRTCLGGMGRHIDSLIARHRGAT